MSKEVIRMYDVDTKFYFGPDSFSCDIKNQLSLGTIGLLEKYSSMVAFNSLKHPWVTIEDILHWCNDDVRTIEAYINEGIRENCLISLSEEQATKLLQDPIHNCWLYE